MVRREIKKFRLIYGEERAECSVPCSAVSVLGDKAADLDALRFEAVIYVDAAALNMKHFYLRIGGISLPCEIFVGENKLADLDGGRAVCNIDLAGKLTKGDNILSIRFDRAAAGALTYAGLSLAPEIIRFSGAIIDRVFLSQTHSEGAVNLGINLELIGDPGSVRAVATLVSSTGQIYYAGLTKGQGNIQINDPLYWWPKGQGVQNLYRLTVNLWGENDVEDSATLRIGLRTVEAGENGSLLVNGLSVLPMGAVFTPEGDPDFTKADERTATLVNAASRSGFNCLILPLGAPSASEKLFELCDSLGIMVIEEHSAITEADAKALHTRGHHPSLCLIDLIASADEEGDRARLGAELPDLKLNALEKAPEYIGLPTLPSMKTIQAAIPEGQRSLFSYEIESLAEEGAVNNMLLSVAERYPYPRDLSSFAYASALAAAHRVGDCIKAGRLSGGESGRPVFYRLRDTEMVISPSAIDNRGRWKPLQHYASRHFAPIALYADIQGGRVSFSVSSQRRTSLIGKLEYRIADSSNYTVFCDSIDCEISAFEARELYTADLSEYISGHERDYYIEYYLKEGTSVISRRTALFVPEKHFNFKKPKLKTVISGQERSFSITLSADCFVKDMEIDFDGVDALFSDNYFDLTSEAPVKISFTVSGGIETSYHLKDVLSLRSVYDLK